jgi:hypothetical protein
VLGTRCDLVAARHLDELQAAVVGGVELLQFLDLRLEDRLVEALEHPGQLLHGHRLLRNEG